MCRDNSGFAAGLDALVPQAMCGLAFRSNDDQIASPENEFDSGYIERFMPTSVWVSE
jgi:hypothetical protein